MDQGVEHVAELGSRLLAKRGQVWVSAVANRLQTSGTDQLIHFEVVSGLAPSAQSEKFWDYGSCWFARSKFPASTVGRLLTEPGPHRFNFGGSEVNVEVTATQSSWWRLPSLWRFSGGVFPWPWLQHEFPFATGAGLQTPSQMMVGVGATPSFPAFSAAFNAFFFDNFAISGSQGPPLGSMYVRELDHRGRIAGVRVGTTSISVRIGGRDLASTILELNGVEYRTSHTVNGSGWVHLPLPQGQPSEAWLWLKRGSEWLDRRSLDPWGGFVSPDVIVEKDLTSELSGLLAQGEGPHIEFKEQLPEAGKARTALKSVAAFANGLGGVVIYGAADDGSVVGLKGSAKDLLGKLQELLRSAISPTPHLTIDSRRIDGKLLILVSVQPGDGTLYALTIDQSKPEYYVRRGATTYYARPEEIAAITRATTPNRLSQLWSG